jgi:hypothetical protein
MPANAGMTRQSGRYVKGAAVGITPISARRGVRAETCGAALGPGVEVVGGGPAPAMT